MGSSTVTVNVPKAVAPAPSWAIMVILISPRPFTLKITFLPTEVAVTTIGIGRLRDEAQELVVLVPEERGHVQLGTRVVQVKRQVRDVAYQLRSVIGSRYPYPEGPEETLAFVSLCMAVTVTSVTPSFSAVIVSS